MKKYISFMGIHWLIPLLVISIFAKTFQYPSKTIFLHIASITCLLISITISLAIIHKIFPKKWSMFLSITTFYFLFVFLSLLYLTNYISNFHWRENIYFQLVYDFTLNSSKTEIFTSIYFWLLTFLFVVVLYFYCKSGEIIYSGTHNLLLSPKKIGGRISVGFLSILVAIVIVIALLVVIVYNFDYTDESTQGDPLLSFFFEPEKHSPKVEQAIYEQKIRNNYPKDIPFQKKNVALIIVDALRSDHTSLYGYPRKTTPFLQSLYDAGKLKKVDMALSNFVASTGGILATLSSRHFRDMHYANFKLHNLLKDQGYTVNFILTGLHNWYGLRKFYNLNDIDFFFDGTCRTKHYINDDRIIFEALEKVPSYNNNPNFFYFHLMSTHSFGVHRKEFEIFKDPENYHIDRYDNGIVQSDHYIKKIFEALNEKGYMENIMIVILADHGEFLGEKDLYGHGKCLYQACLQIPMLIYDTEEIPYQNLEFATQLDVAPTIVDRLGLPKPECWEGNSLISQKKQDYSLHEMFIKRDLFSTILHKNDKIYKYILSLNLKEELYELKSDPQENNNILDKAELQLLDELREKCRKLIDSK